VDYDWLKDNKKFSKPMISRKMMTKVCAELWKEVLSSEKKMAALDQEGFTLAIDKTIEGLRNGAKNTSKSTSFLLKCYYDQNLTSSFFFLYIKSIHIKYLPCQVSRLCVPERCDYLSHNFLLRSPAITKFEYGREQLKKLRRKGK